VSEISEITGSRKTSSKGFIIYEISVRHPELGRKKVFKGEYPFMIERKAEALAAQWDAIGEKKMLMHLKSSPSARLQKSRSDEIKLSPNGRLNLDATL